MKHVTFHLPSFLRRVRIHGGEFDSSARAMNREKQVRLLQADLRIVRGSTIERKQMSTTIKRVALVAVAALGFGVISVAPSQAATQADTLAISATTAAIMTGETATVTLTGTFLSGATAAGDTMTIVASATALPTGATTMPILTASDTVNAVIAVTQASFTSTIQSIAVSTATSGKITVAVPVLAAGKVGTYSYKFTPTVQGGGALNSAAVYLTVTVTASPADDLVVSAAKSTVWIQTGETATAGSAADSATVVAKTLAPTAQAATIIVSAKNANGTTLATQPALTAIVKTGTPGTVGSAVSTNTSDMVSAGRAIPVTAGYHIGVFSDGTAGVAEVEIYAGTVLLATKKVTFFGDVASYTGTFTPKALGVGETSTITVTGKDAAGNAATVGTVYYTTSDSSVATVSSAGVVTGVKSGKSTISICNTSACTAATITSTVAVQIGAVKAATVALSFSNATPTAGEKVTVTLTATDASGNAVADGARFLVSSAGFSPSVTVSGSTLPTGETVTLSAGVATYIFYAPAAGTVTFTATEGSATDSTTKGTITGSVTVSNPGLDAATDAAIEAFDAANAATDAALSAAEAADLATQAAQEASDAVAALSETVTQLIAGLQAQIKSLAAVVAKIAAATAKIQAQTKKK